MQSSLITKFSKVVRYGIFGAVSALAEFLTFILLKDHFHLYIASTISFIIGLFVSFVSNKYFVFRKKDMKVSEVVQFIILGVVNSQLSSLITVGLSLILPLWISKGLTIGIVAIWNYLLMNHIIFRQNKRD